MSVELGCIIPVSKRTDDLGAILDLVRSGLRIHERGISLQIQAVNPLACRLQNQFIAAHQPFQGLFGLLAFCNVVDHGQQQMSISEIEPRECYLDWNTALVFGHAAEFVGSSGHPCLYRPMNILAKLVHFFRMHLADPHATQFLLRVPQ